MLWEIGHDIPDLMVDTTTSGWVLHTQFRLAIKGVGDRGLRALYVP